ncbi:MAG: LysR family transcriptional regulator [Clostridium sp.]
MDIKYMEYVLALAKAGNITQAAKDLYISQPTLSQFIRNYQNTLGIHLFKRMNGRYTLTSAGETFCKYAEQIIELEKNMEQAMQTYKNTTILKIGTSTTKAISMVTHLIPIYRKEFPNIDIAMSEGNSFTIISKVLNNDLDLVFGSISSLDLYKGQILPLKEEKIALAVPSRMLFAATQTITIFRVWIWKLLQESFPVLLLSFSIQVPASVIWLTACSVLPI